MRLSEIDTNDWNRLSADRAPSKDDYEKYASLIKRDCQPYLSQVDSPFSLFSGSRKPFEHFQRKAVRLTDRNPVGASQQEHKVYNDYFTKNYGEPFRNALFATGNKSDAQAFGTPNIVFPIGDFTFLWSPQVYDLNMKIGFATPGRIEDEELISKISKFGYYMVNLKGAIKSGNEIMIRVKDYYMMNAQQLLFYARRVDAKTGFDIGRLFK